MPVHFLLQSRSCIERAKRLAALIVFAVCVCVRDSKINISHVLLFYYYSCRRSAQQSVPEDGGAADDNRNEKGSRLNYQADGIRAHGCSADKLGRGKRVCV